jgi:L-asparaginase
VSKTNTVRLDAFSAPGRGPVGVADPDTVVFWRAPARERCEAPAFDLAGVTDLPRVDIIYSYIGADSVLIDAAVAAGAKGLVLASVGRGGSTPTQERALRRAADRGVFVAVSSRTGGGRASVDAEELTRWKPGRGALVSAEDLNPQKARVLLMLAPLPPGGSAGDRGGLQEVLKREVLTAAWCVVRERPRDVTARRGWPERQVTHHAPRSSQ